MPNALGGRELTAEHDPLRITLGTFAVFRLPA
jgi:hypothetical protein